MEYGVMSNSRVFDVLSLVCLIICVVCLVSSLVLHLHTPKPIRGYMVGYIKHTNPVTYGRQYVTVQGPLSSACFADVERKIEQVNGWDTNTVVALSYTEVVYEVIQ